MIDIKTIEKKIFSQHGEDGIINFLSDNLKKNSNYFVEIGCGKGRENNSRNLFYNNWNGLICDIYRNIDQYTSLLRKQINKEQFSSLSGLINLDNINHLIDLIKDKDIAFLSLDIDSYDFFILKELFENKIYPKILCLEYNCFLTGTTSVKYSKNFDRRKYDKYYGLFFGCSLGSYKALCEKYGYSFFTVDTSGTNAFFVLNNNFSDKIKNILTIDFSYNKYYIKRHNLTAEKLEKYLLDNFDKDLIDIKCFI
jgi:hypothetical protein